MMLYFYNSNSNRYDTIMCRNLIDKLPQHIKDSILPDRFDIPTYKIRMILEWAIKRHFSIGGTHAVPKRDFSIIIVANNFGTTIREDSEEFRELTQFL